VLIHEVQTPAWRAGAPERFQRFAEKYHTSTLQLADLAKQAKPRLLILYHYNGLTDQELFSDMASRYSGQFVIGRDLDVY
jgi:ribonuclease BN (tRNA processing enzyme)